MTDHSVFKSMTRVKNWYFVGAPLVLGGMLVFSTGLVVLGYFLVIAGVGAMIVERVLRYKGLRRKRLLRLWPKNSRRVRE